MLKIGSIVAGLFLTACATPDGGTIAAIPDPIQASSFASAAGRAPAFPVISPADPLLGLDSLHCEAPPGLDVAWHVDGVPWPAAIVEAKHTRPGQRWTCAVVGQERTQSASVTPRPAATNVLVIVADDLGIDKVAAYGEYDDPPPTPSLSGLADEGVLFRNAYSSPQCSPTRANALTGRYGGRYGVGSVVVASQSDWGVPATEMLIPRMLESAPQPWDHSAVGKWHLGDRFDGTTHPNDAGFAWFSGALGNLSEYRDTARNPSTFHHWHKTTNGSQEWVDTYATTDNVDDALSRIDAMEGPWFLWLAFNAGHDPQHVPPEDLRTLDVALDSPDADKYDAAIEAMDSEIGRLLASMDPQTRASTTIVFLGDNGTNDAFMVEPVLGAKSTLFEAGIHVPMIVSGPLVAAPGTESDALVHAVDLFATVAAIAGVDAQELRDDEGRPVTIDGVSWLPCLADPSIDDLRPTIYAERFSPNGLGPYSLDARTVFDGRYKLITSVGSPTLFFDLQGQITEGEELLAIGLTAAEQVAYDQLQLEMERHVSDVVLDPRLFE